MKMNKHVRALLTTVIWGTGIMAASLVGIGIAALGFKIHDVARMQRMKRNRERAQREAVERMWKQSPC